MHITGRIAYQRVSTNRDPSTSCQRRRILTAGMRTAPVIVGAGATGSRQKTLKFNIFQVTRGPKKNPYKQKRTVLNAPYILHDEPENPIINNYFHLRT